ncbi:MAG: T9SS type A sorting domain-containing protein, partial [Flavobacterium sp.]|nr:T9SS type A sorting domain-containing protein [Flavobacterium sp.]
NELSQDTLNDSLQITGNSMGWIHSHVSIYMENITQNVYPDSLILRFTFVSDSINTNEGWQIDSICMKMDYLNKIKEIQPLANFLRFYPNPSTGYVNFDLKTKDIYSISITNSLGQEVEAFVLTENKTIK